jgi:hypothetical protein
MRTDVIRLCSFTTGLDELPKKSQGSIKAVLRFLKASKKISIFEATANQVIAKTVDKIYNKKLVDAKIVGFPWHEIRLTAAGRRWLRKT